MVPLAYLFLALFFLFYQKGMEKRKKKKNVSIINECIIQKQFLCLLGPKSTKEMEKNGKQILCVSHNRQNKKDSMTSSRRRKRTGSVSDFFTNQNLPRVLKKDNLHGFLHEYLHHFEKVEGRFFSFLFFFFFFFFFVVPLRKDSLSSGSSPPFPLVEVPFSSPKPCHLMTTKMVG